MSYLDVLKLRVRTFFSLYNEGNKLQAKEYLEKLKISLCQSRMKIEYVEQLEKSYLSVIHPEMKKLPERTPMPGLDLASVETKNQIIQFFARSKRRPVHGR